MLPVEQSKRLVAPPDQVGEGRAGLMADELPALIDRWHEQNG